MNTSCKIAPLVSLYWKNPKKYRSSLDRSYYINRTHLFNANNNQTFHGKYMKHERIMAKLKGTLYFVKCIAINSLQPVTPFINMV